MGSSKFFSERSDACEVAQWAREVGEKYFTSLFALQRFVLEEIQGLDINVVTPQMIPGCCCFAAPVVTAALREKGCKDAATVTGKHNESSWHAWTQVSLCDGDFVIDSTYAQFLHVPDTFLVYPTTELSHRSLTHTGAHPEYDDSLTDFVRTQYRTDVRRLLRNMFETLVFCGGAEGT